MRTAEKGILTYLNLEGDRDEADEHFIPIIREREHNSPRNKLITQSISG